jgi:hypothetical protein
MDHMQLQEPGAHAEEGHKEETKFRSTRLVKN